MQPFSDADRLHNVEMDLISHKDRLHHVRICIDSLSADMRSVKREVHTEVSPRLARIDAHLSKLEDGRTGLDARMLGLETQVISLDKRLSNVEVGVGSLLAHFGLAETNEPTG